MEKVVEIFGWIATNYQTVLASLVLILSGVIGVCMLIPGEQPEKTLQKIVDFIKKFSVKSE